MKASVPLIVALALCVPLRAQERGDALKTVEVTAEGYDKDDALKQALRKALEQGAGVQIAGFSKVENYELARDTIFSRAFGIVKDYQILEHREVAGGVWKCRVRATVRPDAVAQAWGEVVNLLAQLGNPKILITVEEKIDGDVQSDSIVEHRLAELFTKAGFTVLSRAGVADIQRREVDAALLADDQAKLMRLAKDAGAQILIRGSARADSAGARSVYGTSVVMYNCTVMAQAYYTDTAKLLASESIPTTERGVRSFRSHSPQAAALALTAATFPDTQRHENKLAVRLFDAVMESWSQELTAGGDLVLEVEKLSFRTYVKLKKALEELKNVSAVHGEFDEHTAKFRVKATLSAETLAEKLLDAPFGEWIEIDSQKQNTVKAHGVE
jgi:hypothetical protein